MARRGATKATAEKGEPTWVDRFIEVISVNANVLRACEAAGIERSTAYRHAAKPEGAEFKRRWDEAIQSACDRLEEAAWNRATGRHQPSDTLLIFLLKAHRPERYRENVKVEHAGVIEHEHRHTVTLNEARKLPSDERRRRVIEALGS